MAFKFIFLSILLFSSSPVFSEVSEFKFSTSQIVQFKNAGKDFRKSGRRNKIQLKLPKNLIQNEITLVPHEIRANNYSESENNNLIRSGARKLTFFKSPNESPDFFNRLVLVEDVNNSFVMGYLKRNGKYFSLEKTNSTLLGSGSDTSYVVEEAHEFSELAACGLVHNNSPISLNQNLDQSDFSTSNLVEPISLAAATKEVELATEADYEYYLKFGSGSAANAKILAIVSGISAFYENSFNITFKVVHQNVWTTSSDPYTSSSSSTMLTQFRSHWESNFSGSVGYDLAHMWTGKDMEGSTVGIAYFGTVCSSARYGVSQFLEGASEVVVSTHEIAHNFSAAHDSCSSSSNWIMCPYVIPFATQFSPASLNAINTNLNSYSCLDSGSGTPIPTPTPTPSPTPTPTPVPSPTPRPTIIPTPRPTVPVPTPQPTRTPAPTATPRPTFIPTPAPTARPPATPIPTPQPTQTPVPAPRPTILPPAPSPKKKNTNEEIVSYLPSRKEIRFNSSKSLRTIKTTPAKGSYLLTGDFNGDRKLDYANFKDGTWKITTARGKTISRQLGVTGDLPIVGDFDGDNISDIAVYRPNDSGIYSRWYVIKSTDNLLSSAAWGLAGDIPVPMDITGDGRDDFIVLRPANMIWYGQDSVSGTIVFSEQWGLSGDLPCTGDFNEDGYADLCVYQWSTNTFQIKLFGGGTISSKWGSAEDVPFTYGTNILGIYRKKEGRVYSLYPKTGATKRINIAPSKSNLILLSQGPKFNP